METRSAAESFAQRHVQVPTRNLAPPRRISPSSRTYAKAEDADRNKGAVEQDRPSQETNTSLQGQLPHRDQDPNIKAHDTDYPEPGENPEHSGEPRTRSLVDRDAGCENPRTNREGEAQDQDPGERQKQNQSGEKDDPLAA